MTEYHRAGVRLVRVVDVGQAQVVVQDSPTQARILHQANTIDGGVVLPGF